MQDYQDIFLREVERFIPTGAHIVNLGFAKELLCERLPEAYSYCSPEPKLLDHTDLLNSAIEVPRQSYVLLSTSLTHFPSQSRVLRAIMSSAARLLFPYISPDGSSECVPDAFLREIRAAGFILRSSARPGCGLVVMCVSACVTGVLNNCRVVVLSGGGPNFGDRLGLHIINPLLPAHACVQHETSLSPSLLDEPIDLLILGLGNSIFQPLFSEALFRLVDHSRRVVGIFGTQYRRGIDRRLMKRLLGGLHIWYARYLEDLLIFGGECPCVHLGDWLISAFPLARPRHRPQLAETLVVGPEISREQVPLDQLILKIQSYRRVVSARVHPLLCALTSAEEVAYYEQRELGGEDVSGKFRSMLLDVFGFHYPEERFFNVDRDAIRRYKEFVDLQLSALRQDLRRACTND